MDAAVAALAEADQPAAAAAPAAVQQDEQAQADADAEVTEESEAVPAAEDVDDPEDDPAIEDEDADEVDPEEGPAIDAPASWDAEERAEFAKLPPETQKIVLARETERDRRVSKALQEASDARKGAEQQASGIAEYKANLDQLVNRARAQFGASWDNVDWQAWAQKDPDAALRGHFQMQAEQAELGRLEKAQKDAEAVEFQNFITAEAAKLKDVAPHLADPKEGLARRQAVSKYLLESGVPEPSLKFISALELSIADKARRWDEAQAKMAKPRTTNPAADPALTPSARPTVRPSAGQAVTGKQRSTSQISHRLSQTKSFDDAVDLILAKGL